MGLSILGGAADRAPIALQDDEDPIRAAEPVDLGAAGGPEEPVTEIRPSNETVESSRRALGAETERLRGHLDLVVPEEDNAERRQELAEALQVPGQDPGLVAAQTLAGQSPLGELGAEDREMFVEEMVDGWRADDLGMDFDRRMGSLRAGMSILPGAASGTADPLAAAAVETLENAANRRDQIQAASLGTTAVQAAETPEARRELLETLGPDAAGLATSLQLGDTWTHGDGADRVERAVAAGNLLEAAALGDPTDASRDTTQAIFEQLPSEAYNFTDRIPGQMAGALASHWHPNDAEARQRETERFTGILETSQGQELLGASENIPPEMRARVLDIIRSDPSIDGEALAAHGDSGWTHPGIAEELARPRAQAFVDGRGDEPVELGATALSNTVGIAMSLPPTLPPGETEEEREAREATFGLEGYDYYRNGEYADSVDAVTDAIQEFGGPNAAVTVLPIQHSSGAAGPVELPLFRVQDAETGEDRFVDNVGRQYESFEAWQANNVLPAGNVVYPEGGHLTADPDGQAILRSENSHATVDTASERALAVADGAVMVGGVVAGGLVIAGSGGTAAPFVFAGASAYGTVRSGQRLADRAQHGESLNPIRDAGARSAWLELGANALGLSGAGASIGAATLSRAGNAYAPLVNRAAGQANLVATGADGAAIADGAHQMATNWDQMSGGQRAQLGLSMAFWGTSIPARQRIRPDTTPAPRATGPRPDATWTDADYHSAYMSHAPYWVQRELEGVTPAELRAVFPEGGAYPSALDDAAGHAGFGAAVRDNPELARAFVNANQVQGGGIPFASNDSIEFWNNASMMQTPHPLDPTFVLRQRGPMVPESRPELEITAGASHDHNGAMRDWSRLGSTSEYGNSLMVAPSAIQGRHLLVDGQPRPDMNGVAIFNAHGSNHGFDGASNAHAARMMADGIATRTAAGRPIDTVVLRACNQRNMGLDFRANAQRYERRLNQELAARGLPPVQVLAARDPGITAGTSQENSLTGERYPTAWTPAADGARIDPRDAREALRTTLIGGGLATAGYFAVSELGSRHRGELSGSLRRAITLEPLRNLFYTPVSDD